MRLLLILTIVNKLKTGITYPVCLIGAFGAASADRTLCNMMKPAEIVTYLTVLSTFNLLSTRFSKTGTE